MTQYELPDGFEGMETVLRDRYVTLIKPNGYQSVHWIPSNQNISLEYVGWAPIVPLKAKPRFVVERSVYYWRHWKVSVINPYRCVADDIPTEDAAQRIADIYNEVMP